MALERNISVDSSKFPALEFDSPPPRTFHSLRPSCLTKDYRNTKERQTREKEDVLCEQCALKTMDLVQHRPALGWLVQGLFDGRNGTRGRKKDESPVIELC